MTMTSNSRNMTDRTRSTTPGWPELLAGGVVYGGSFLLVGVFLPLIKDDGVAGIVGLIVSGLIGLIAFAAAVLIRIRGLAVFGIRRAKPRHLVVGAALGLAAFVVGTVVAVTFTVLTGDQQNVQGSYQAAAAGGALSVLFTFVAGSIITPIGEEAFFRGVVANALLRHYGMWVGVIGSAALFAVAHGFNPVFIVAFIVGILTALLFRWSGSIWPGVVLHGVNNAAALLLPVAIAAVAN
jgi:membrane protease YdiL (CAAX protease family)